MMTAIPTLILGVLCLLKGGKRRLWLPFGLLLSAVGDAAGAMGHFGIQLAAFALALCCYTANFAPHSRFRVARIGWLAALLIPFCAALWSLLARVDTTAEAVAVGIYATILFILLSITLMQEHKGWRWSVAASLLFILSDALIGYSRYVEPLSAADWWILSPYYAAQTIFAWRYLAEEDK